MIRRLVIYLTSELWERLQAALPFVVYPIFSAIDLCGIYQGLKHVHLQTLTKVDIYSARVFDSSVLLNFQADKLS